VFHTVMRAVKMGMLIGLPILMAGPAHSRSLPLLTGDATSLIVTDEHEPIQVAGNMLKRDIEMVTGRSAEIATKLDLCPKVCIVVGRFDGPLVQGIAKTYGIDLTRLSGRWESYQRQVIDVPDSGGKKMVLLAGSDVRGAIYAVVDLSRELGVSAWEWWADVKPRVQPDVTIDDTTILSSEPSVKYRGIFINDEDWGLQPWAAQHDPSGDIGPVTYARIFELMTRLKANLVWPAMHDSTKPFYQIEGNAQVAQRYGIVVGTSHAEPMMRNNVREWDHAMQGEFNFFKNRSTLLNYWKERLVQVKGGENIYTVGIRGVHDTAMEGANSIMQARDAMQEVIGLQRALLADVTNKPAEDIPQVLTLYKEVLDVYKAGLAVPADVTLIWTDDNYGYLHQLSTPAEARRRGGTGLYYHLSYWGRPHDYLWLGSTHPELVRDQLQRAVASGTNRLWVVNVGDIKSIEYLGQYFLDAAFDTNLLRQPAYVHLTEWLKSQFGPGWSEGIAALMRDYYDLAWERRPEFMGFSQVETITPVRQSSYLLDGGAEAERRLERYDDLTRRAEYFKNQIPASLQDAYFQLVLYPIRSSANINRRTLGYDLAVQYAREGRHASNTKMSMAELAHSSIGRDTQAYNALGGGKWLGIMDAAPRRLPVFKAPAFAAFNVAQDRGCYISYPNPFSHSGESVNFVRGLADEFVVTLIQRGALPQPWSVATKGGNLELSPASGQLNQENGFEQRIKVKYRGTDEAVSLEINCGADHVRLNVRTRAANTSSSTGEREGIIALPAAVAEADPGWTALEGLGSYGLSQRANFDVASRPLEQARSAPKLSFRFNTHSAGEARLRVVGLPVHPLSASNRVRMAYSLNGSEPQLLDFETHGRSDEWKSNVLSNTAVRTIGLSHLMQGEHKLEIYALDPGVILDRVEIRFDGAPESYGRPM